MNTQLFHDLAASEEASGYPENARALRAVPDVVAALREVYEGYLSEPGSEFDWSHWGEVAGAALAAMDTTK